MNGNHDWMKTNFNTFVFILFYLDLKFIKTYNKKQYESNTCISKQCSNRNPKWHVHIVLEQSKIPLPCEDTKCREHLSERVPWVAVRLFFFLDNFLPGLTCKRFFSSLFFSCFEIVQGGEILN